MKNLRLFKRVTACTLALLLAIPFTTMPQLVQESLAQSSEQLFRAEELDQMLAPIALYPDALLAQVLTAATYPLEVVEADRFAKDNPGLKGQALLEAAKYKDWEPSVKAMLEFPDVLAMMDEQLEWTRKLGDAFLSQQQDCMDSIQRLRQKAYAQGNLTSTKEQVVSVEPQTRYIIIEPAVAEVVYVPVYDPTIIYGAWWYPVYPPYYFYPRRYYGISFFTGVFVGAFWGFWGTWGCDWHSRYVHININYYNNFTRNYYDRNEHYRPYSGDRSQQPWQHDPQHRKGVGYGDLSTAERYGRTLRAEPTRTPIAPMPTVKPQANVTQSPSTGNQKDKVPKYTRLYTTTRSATRQQPSGTATTQSRPNIQKDNRVGVGDTKPLNSKPVSEVKVPLYTRPYTQTQGTTRQQPFGTTTTQSRPNIQKDDRAGVAVIKPSKSNPISDVKVPAYTRPYTTTQSATSVNNNFRAEVKQSIGNFRENVSAQDYSRQPSIRSDPSSNAAPRLIGEIGRAGRR